MRDAASETTDASARFGSFEAVDKRAGRLALKRFRVGKAKAWKDGALVLVMDRIDGESLAELRKKGFRASVSDVQRHLADASRALAYLHGRTPPVVHRDLKPGNVIRRPDGSYAFVDFGAVRDRLKLAGGKRQRRRGDAVDVRRGGGAALRASRARRTRRTR